MEKLQLQVFATLIWIWVATGNESLQDIQEVKSTRECQGILNPQAYTYTEDKRRSGVLTHDDLVNIPRNRLFLFIPRFGLGNVLRAYPASLIFALLSGRELILTVLGHHWRVIHHLCGSLECTKKLYIERKSFDDVRPRLVPRDNMTEIYSMLQDNTTLLGVNSAWEYDDYWMKSKELRECVMALFHCETKWCVYSRAFQNLIKGLTPAAEKNIVRHTKVQMLLPGNQTVSRSLKTGHISSLRFDIAIHIRTVTRLLEGFASCNTSDVNCRQTQQMERKQEKEILSIFQNSNIFSCLEYFLESFQHTTTDMESNVDQEDGGLPPRRKETSPETLRRPHIFFATDFPNLRPIYVNFLKSFGWVYFSSGTVIHTSKEKEENTTAASDTVNEFYLMSRSYIVLAIHGRRISTFAETAAKFGNSSFVTMNYFRKSCDFVYWQKV